MNNKSKTYLLVFAVLFVWGTIGYKITIGTRPNVLKVIAQDLDVTFIPKLHTQKDTFSIQNVRRDPFLGHLIAKSTTRMPRVKKTNYKSPVITYSGLIKQQNASNKVFVINSNNKQYLLKKGQKVDSITLIRGNAQAVIIKYNSKTLTIKRQ